MLALSAAAAGREPETAGQGRLVARCERDGEPTVVIAARATSPLRWVMPVFAGARAAAACIVTFGGGLVDGDRIDVDVDVGPGATLLLFTQASTKVFRGRAAQSLRARVDGTLVLLPDPVAAFAAAEYTQRIDVALGDHGACVLADGYTAGRPAFGERWAMEALDLRTTVTHRGRVLVRDALRLGASDGAIAERAAGFDAFATLIAAGHGARPVARAILQDHVAPPTSGLAMAASPLPRAAALGIPGAIARVAAASPAMALAAVRSRLRNLPEMGVVDPWASRHLSS